MGPSTGGGFTGGGPSRGGGRGRGASTGTSRKTFIEWKDSVLTKPGVATLREGEEAVSEADQLRKMLCVDSWDPRPTLLYYHRNHFEPGEATAWAKQCKHFDDEEVARWAQLYVCVEVDIDKSDKEMLERFGAQEGPSFAIVDGDLKVRAKSGVLGSGKKIEAFLKATAKKEFPKYWEEIEGRLDEQKKLLSEARALMKKSEFQEARDRVRDITQSQLRIGKTYAEALKLETKLAREIDD